MSTVFVLHLFIVSLSITLLSEFGCALYLLSLDEPCALGLVLIVSRTIREVARGPRQPERKEEEGTRFKVTNEEVTFFFFQSKQAEILETVSSTPSHVMQMSTTDGTAESPKITAVITKIIVAFMQNDVL